MVNLEKEVSKTFFKRAQRTGLEDVSYDDKAVKIAEEHLVDGSEESLDTAAAPEACLGSKTRAGS